MTSLIKKMFEDFLILTGVKPIPQIDLNKMYKEFKGIEDLKEYFLPILNSEMSYY